jgi:hypothetical protein
MSVEPDAGTLFEQYRVAAAAIGADAAKKANVLRCVRARLRRVVDQHNEARRSLILTWVEAGGLTWCTKCRKRVQTAETALILLEGRERYSHGYENSFYAFRGFSRLHRACTACCEETNDRHGTTGPYDDYAKDQARFFAFRVEVRDDGYYVRRFGDWDKLDGEKYNLPDLTDDQLESVANEAGAPPILEFDSIGRLVAGKEVIATYSI